LHGLISWWMYEGYADPVPGREKPEYTMA
jgi:hypothetical protein